MKNLKSLLGEKFFAASQKALGDVDPTHIEITPATQEKFGHYQCNSALKLAKIFGKNPREIANSIIDNLDKEDLISHLEIAGPGFVNITIHPSFLSKELTKMLSDPYLGVEVAENRLPVIVEFSSPNIAKELHVGHLRSTIIGESIARILDFFGHDVKRLNHVGDWGTQFGMLIWYLKSHHPEVIEETDQANLDDLVAWYKKAKEAFDQDPEFKKKAQEEVVKLQAKEENTYRAWQHICDISRRRFEEIYNLLDVSIEERGESFYNPYLPQVVADFEEKKLLTISDGASCVFMDEFKGKEGSTLPLIIKKSDGGYNYATTDLAGFKYRIQQDGAKRIVIVTDAGQNLHFSMVSKAAELVGYLDPNQCHFDHVTFGVVLNEEGKKFKTRSGETVKLIDLLQEAIDRARTIFEERFDDIDPQELETSAKILGINAVKYADLSSSRTKDYVFSFDRMLRFQGNTAVFLLYSYVRIRSIQRKVTDSLETVQKEHTITLAHPSEIALGLHVRRFGEILEVIERELTPHLLAEYLYALAEKFNAFFRDCRVEGDEQEGPRFLLAELTARILEKGLYLLGLKTLEKM